VCSRLAQLRGASEGGNGRCGRSRWFSSEYYLYIIICSFERKVRRRPKRWTSHLLCLWVVWQTISCGLNACSPLPTHNNHWSSSCRLCLMFIHLTIVNLLSWVEMSVLKKVFLTTQLKSRWVSVGIIENDIVYFFN